MPRSIEAIDDIDNLEFEILDDTIDSSSNSFPSSSVAATIAASKPLVTESISKDSASYSTKYQRLYRSRLSEERRQQIRASEAEKKRLRRANMTPEERAEQRKVWAEHQRLRRARMTEEQHDHNRFIGMIRQRHYRSQKTDEEREEERKANRDRVRQHRASMSDEERTMQRQMNAMYQRRRRERLNPQYSSSTISKYGEFEVNRANCSMSPYLNYHQEGCALSGHYGNPPPHSGHSVYLTVSDFHNDFHACNDDKDIYSRPRPNTLDYKPLYDSSISAYPHHDPFRKCHSISSPSGHSRLGSLSDSFSGSSHCLSKNNHGDGPKHDDFCHRRLGRLFSRSDVDTSLSTYDQSHSWSKNDDHFLHEPSCSLRSPMEDRYRQLHSNSTTPSHHQSISPYDRHLKIETSNHDENPRSSRTPSKLFRYSPSDMEVNHYNFEKHRLMEAASSPINAAGCKKESAKISTSSQSPCLSRLKSLMENSTSESQNHITNGIDSSSVNSSKDSATPTLDVAKLNNSTTDDIVSHVPVNGEEHMDVSLEEEEEIITVLPATDSDFTTLNGNHYVGLGYTGEFYSTREKVALHQAQTALLNLDLPRPCSLPALPTQSLEIFEILTILLMFFCVLLLVFLVERTFPFLFLQRQEKEG